MSENTRIYRNNVWLAVISVVALVIAFALILMSLTARDLVSGWLLGFFSLVFGFSGIVNLQKADDESPAIEISETGILVKDISSIVIPWPAIVEANLWRTRAVWNITLKLVPGQMAAIRPRFGSRRPFSRDRVAFMASYLDRSPSSVFTLISSRLGTGKVSS